MTMYDTHLTVAWCSPTPTQYPPLTFRFCPEAGYSAAAVGRVQFTGRGPAHTRTTRVWPAGVVVWCRAVSGSTVVRQPSVGQPLSPRRSLPWWQTLAPDVMMMMCRRRCSCRCTQAELSETLPTASCSLSAVRLFRGRFVSVWVWTVPGVFLRSQLDISQFRADSDPNACSAGRGRGAATDISTARDGLGPGDGGGGRVEGKAKNKWLLPRAFPVTGSLAGKRLPRC